MNNSAEIRYFSQQDLWSRDAVSEQLAVARELIALIPHDVATILDAGCGNGTVTNALLPHWDVIGCDFSESAVRHLNGPALVADLRAIPFADKKFDLVLSSDVIEHLPDAIYSQALKEIARVSARYVLVAVPYRELLEAAGINCPACGHRYHAHLHQRAYAVDDVVSLFAPEFTAISIRLAGECWTFEDPELVGMARRLSGLDYPFEEAVCPECATRRGPVEQSARARKVYRRFESLQAMLVAQGWRERPPRSEILVLFKRNAQAEKSELMVGLPEPDETHRLQISSLIERSDPTSYPRRAYRIQSGPDYCTLALVRRPAALSLVAGNFETVEIYDHVRAHYVAVSVENKNLAFEVPVVPFGPHGCLLRILRPSTDLEFQLTLEHPNWLNVVDCCLGDDSAMDRIRQDSSRLLALTESLETARAELEVRFQEKERTLNESVQSAAELNELANEIERKRSGVEERFARFSLLLADKETQIEEQRQRIKIMSADQRRLTSEQSRLETEKDAVLLDLERLKLECSRLIHDLSEEKSRHQVLVDAMAINQGAASLGDAGTCRKVLIVSHMYPRDYNPAGGIFVHEQVKALRAQGIDARVVSGEPFWINTLNPKRVKQALDSYRAQTPGAWEDHDGVPVIRFPYIVSGALPFQTHAATYTHGLMRQAEWLHDDFPFELVHAHTAYTDGTAGRHLAEKFNVPLVITEHTGPFKTLTRTRYLKRMTQKALNAADCVIAVSSALLGDIKNQVQLKPDVHSSIVANLVDTCFFIEQPRVQNGLINLLWVGHFVPVKRVPVLIEAFARAFKLQSRLRLRLVGSGEGMSEARDLAQSLGVDGVIEFLGHASREQLVEHYRDCDFLVISSESETFGVVAIEAMSCGRPVLTSSCGGPEDIVTHPQLGRIVDKSVDALVAGMLEMALQREGFDGHVIRQVTELRFSAPSVAKRLIAIYSGLRMGHRT